MAVCTMPRGDIFVVLRFRGVHRCTKMLELISANDTTTRPMV